MNAPMVGTNVHYVAYGTPGGEFPAGVCRAAVVTEVQAFPLESGTKTLVSACVLNPTGQFFNRGMEWTDAEKGAPGTCHQVHP